MSRCAEDLVSLGGIAQVALLAVVIHADPHHVADLRTIPESVGEDHRTDDRMVGDPATRDV